MKCFVYDRDWAGARIWFTENKQLIADCIRKENLEWYCNAMNNHDIEKYGLRWYLYYYEMVNYWNNTSNFINDENVIKEYDIFEGQTISTIGGG